MNFNPFGGFSSKGPKHNCFTKKYKDRKDKNGKVKHSNRKNRSIAFKNAGQLKHARHHNVSDWCTHLDLLWLRKFGRAQH